MNSSIDEQIFETVMSKIIDIYKEEKLDNVLLGTTKLFISMIRIKIDYVLLKFDEVLLQIDQIFTTRSKHFDQQLYV